MKLCRTVLLLSTLLAASVISRCQEYDYPDYQDYANDYESQDGLYQEYAERQDQKAVG